MIDKISVVDKLNLKDNMKKLLLAFSPLVIVSVSCATTPERVPFFTFTPDGSLLASTAIRSPALPTTTTTQAVPSATLQTATPKPTASAKTNPTATRVWKGGTTLIETPNLSIYYPDNIAADDTKAHADILERAYTTYLPLFGNERPFGKKISIVWDIALTGGAFSGNPITVCGKCPLAFSEFLPPGTGFYHELVHDFTNTGRTRAARYISLNPAMSEAFANYFTYYFQHEVLKYSPAQVASADKVRRVELQLLSQYETAGTSPYGTAWKADTAPQFSFTGMLFRISDRCGWAVWSKFFSTAFNSGNPGIPVQSIDRYDDMSQPAAKKAFANYVALLGQAYGQDLRPMFRNWRFDLP